ncbi:MAG: SDR family oxidoreductase [Gemmatimonadetes bacterium]|nr:SDR family oxidoreductase [Gemmatimonadota bacterium]
MSDAPRVLVTGAAGTIGRALVTALVDEVRAGRVGAVVGTDVRDFPAARPAELTWVPHDVRQEGLARILSAHRITVVVHLAAIVTPGPRSTRAFEYDVDVNGSRRVLDACVAARVRRLVVTSSGAAYGYHPDHPPRIPESWPIRGNEAFAYSHHKRLVEEMLAAARAEQPGLEQVIFRVGPVIGPSVNNQITALFERARLLAIRGADAPFAFIHEADVIRCLVRAVSSPVTGIFNLSGDGALTLEEIAQLLGKRTLVLPAWLLTAALAIAKPLGLSRYGPEQVDFLRYRPVLDNAKLKAEFGFVPAMDSRAAFLTWRDARR